jgi:aryl-alcohol dehydrogenase-like predicted oxidoreductase
MKPLPETAGELRQRVQRLALGTVQFGLAYGVANNDGQVSLPEARQIVGLALEAGIDTIDTAIGYGDSERNLGEIGVAGFKVVTKLPAVPDGVDDVASWANRQVDASMSRLGVSRIYGLLLHRPMDLLGSKGAALFKAICALKERLAVEKIGASIYSPDELQQLTGKYRFDLVQGPLNILDRRLQRSGWLQRLKDRAIEIHTRSAFLQGLLLLPRHDVPAKFARWNSLWDSWNQWSAGDRDAAIQACLSFPLSIAEIDRVVVGADNAEQLRRILSNIAPLSRVLPDLACDDEELINPARWSGL